MRNGRLGCALLMLLLFADMPLAGQEAVGFEQAFAYEARERDNSSRITNRFLQFISASEGGLRAYTSYTFSGNLHVELREKSGGLLVPVIYISELNVSGDHKYRDFELKRMLTPDLMDFRLEIKDAKGRTLHKETVHDFPLPELGQESSLHGLALNGDGPYRAIIDNIRLAYSEEVPERYDAWLSALEDYYRVSTMLGQAEQLSHDLSYTDPERLILDEFRLCEADHLLGLAMDVTFYKWIDLHAHDPEQVAFRTDRLLLRLDSLRHGFNSSISQIDQLFYNLGNELLAEGHIAEALDQYHSSLVYNPFYIPAHLAIAGLQLDSLQKQLALERTGDVLAIMYPDPYLKNKADILADSLFDLYFEETRLFMEDGRYLDALQGLEQLVAFCRKVQGHYPCPDTLNDMLRKGHFGMFQSFMRVAEQAFYNDRLSLALTYLHNAMDYYEAHREFIPDRRFAMLLMQRIANRYQRQGDQAFREGAYDKAAEAFETLIGLCETYAFLICVPDLKDRYQRASERMNTQ